VEKQGLLAATPGEAGLCQNERFLIYTYPAADTFLATGGTMPVPFGISNSMNKIRTRVAGALCALRESSTASAPFRVGKA
jgi:hypothetical protein